MANNNLAIANSDGVLRLNTYNLPLNNRRCSHCKEVYRRRNVTEMWTVRAEGSRYGWQKDTARVCTKCMSEQESERIMGIADVQYKKTVKVKAAA